jgi:vitamin B12 transporter
MHARRLALLLAVFPAVASAQRPPRDTVRIAPVVVTATRSPLAADRAPATVTVITGATLRAQGITTVIDALRQVPGLVLAQTGSYGGATSLFIRGGESKFTKVLVDGVPVNEAGGAFDFATLTTDNIDRIEIVRGPASVLYGSDAVAGVVQLFTRRGTPGVHGDLSVRGGQFGTVDADGSLRGAIGATEFSLGGARHETRGYQAFNSAHRLQVASALLGVQGDASDARLTARYTDGRTGFPTDGSGRVVDSNAVRGESRLALGLDGGVRLAPRVALRLALASHGQHGVTDNQPDSPGDAGGYYYSTADRSSRRSGDLRVDVDVAGASRLTLGGVVERQWQESGTTSSFGDTPAEGRTRRTSGAYAQLLLVPTAAYTATLGARYEHNERFGDFVTWRAAQSLAVRSTRLRASVGTAFREPSFLENFGCCGFVVGNPDLSPEQSVSADVGIEQRVAEWGSVGATLFASSFRNLIDYRSTASGPNYVNLARTRSSGLELEARASLPSGLHADAAFTYLDARVVQPGVSKAATASFVANGRLLRRPMHVVNAGVGYRGAGASLDLRALRTGTREDNYYAPDYSARHLTLPAYTKVDLAGEATLHAASRGRGSVVATLRVENLLDASYTDVAGFNHDFAGPDRASTGYRGAPRRVLGGMRVAF